MQWDQKFHPFQIESLSSFGDFKCMYCCVERAAFGTIKTVLYRVVDCLLFGVPFIRGFTIVNSKQQCLIEILRAYQSSFTDMADHHSIEDGHEGR